MREPVQRKVDLCHVQNQTNRNQHYFERYRAAVEDTERDRRLAESQCRICFYIQGRIGGAMCTAALCSMCDAEMHFGNTCVDVVCSDCARAHRLCRHCGGDVEMKGRRKL